MALPFLPVATTSSTTKRAFTVSSLVWDVVCGGVCASVWAASARVRPSVLIHPILKRNGNIPSRE